MTKKYVISLSVFEHWSGDSGRLFIGSGGKEETKNRPVITISVTNDIFDLLTS